MPLKFEFLGNITVVSLNLPSSKVWFGFQNKKYTFVLFIWYILSYRTKASRPTCGAGHVYFYEHSSSWRYIGISNQNGYDRDCDRYCAILNLC